MSRDRRASLPDLYGAGFSAMVRQRSLTSAGDRVEQANRARSVTSSSTVRRRAWRAAAKSSDMRGSPFSRRTSGGSTDRRVRRGARSATVDCTTASSPSEGNTAEM